MDNVVSAEWGRKFTIRSSVYLIGTLVAFLLSMFMSLTTSSSAFAASTATQVSAGYNHTCAVVDGRAKCWGSNSSRQLGNDSSSDSSTPVDVYTKAAWSEVVKKKTVEHPASVLYGKAVTKISAGYNHTCAVAGARVYCWGTNDSGQLGDRSDNTSDIPVAVDSNRATSALAGKEVVDVSSGYKFTCAFATDGTVACWGKGADGRLGNNSTKDVSSPKAIYTAGALAGKRIVKLGRTIDNAMCVLAVNGTDTAPSVPRYPFCWGFGMGDGTIPGPTHSSSTAYVQKAACQNIRSMYAGTDTDYSYFNTSQPRQYSSTQSFVSVDIDGLLSGNGSHATGIGANGKAYYWGMNGYEKTTTTSVSCGGGTGANGVNSDTGGLCQGGGGAGCNSNITQTTIVDSVSNRIGKLSATGPLYNTGSETINQKTLTLGSGNAYNGIFCASITSGLYCDTHDIARTKAGLGGSGFTTTCDKKNVCTPPIPTDPQKVDTTSWLSDKVVTQASTGPNGHTCVIANDAIACWGENGKGQLGDGTKVDKNVPVRVGI